MLGVWTKSVHGSLRVANFHHDLLRASFKYTLPSTSHIAFD